MSAEEKASALDRFLRLFTDVRAGEGVTALLLATNVFLLMTCYYVLRPIRDGLILSEFSPEVRSYTSAAMVLVLIPVIRLYGILADRVPRQRLINIVTWIFAGCILLFLGLGQLGVPLGIIYFVWLGIFVVMIVAQFWSFANDIYSKEEGERLFPIVALGQSLGPVLGSGIVVVVAGLGIYQLMILGAVLLVVQLQLTNYIDRREQRIKPAVQHTANMIATGSIRIEDIAKMLEEAKTKQAAEDKPAPAPEEGGGMGAYGLVFRTPYLLMIGVLMMLLNFVNTNGEYILSRVVSGRAAEAVAAGQASGLTEAEYITAFYGLFYLGVNLVGALMQLFVVSRVVKYLGVGVGLMILPIMSLGAYSLIAFYPVLTYIRWAKTAENSTDYSLNNTVRNMLFLPTTREQKYKAKQTIDSFFVRVGDTLSAALVLLGTTVLALGVAGFAIVNILAGVIWLALAYKIGREYKRLVGTGETPATR